MQNFYKILFTLVTMEWWTDLWLNEGFASYMEDIGTYHVQPELNIVGKLNNTI